MATHIWTGYIHNFLSPFTIASQKYITLYHQIGWFCFEPSMFSLEHVKHFPYCSLVIACWMIGEWLTQSPSIETIDVEELQRPLSLGLGVTDIRDTDIGTPLGCTFVWNTIGTRIFFACWTELRRHIYVCSFYQDFLTLRRHNEVMPRGWQ